MTELDQLAAAANQQAPSRLNYQRPLLTTGATAKEIIRLGFFFGIGVELASICIKILATAVALAGLGTAAGLLRR